MKIGDVAKAAGMSTSRIRFYERRGLLSPTAREDNGYRAYGKDHVALLRFIELAQSLGFTLKEIADVAPAADGHGISCVRAISLLQSKLTAVNEFIASAEKRRTRIIDLIAQLEKTAANNRRKSKAGERLRA